MRVDQQDSYKTELATTVTGIHATDDGTWVTLQESVFYPTAGGQLHDTGTLEFNGGTASVVDVSLAKDDPNAAVRHQVESSAELSVGMPVVARIDWGRRYRHMQRHSAQHLVSQAFLHVDPRFETHSVSLTSGDVTIDLAGQPSHNHLLEALALARQWGYTNLEVKAFEVPDMELAEYALRRPPKVTGMIRLVQMGDVEIAACGGTHVAHTAEILPLLAVSTQRIRGDLTRITFRAGLEASELAQAALGQVDRLAQSFSASRDDLEARVEQLRDEEARINYAANQVLEAWAHLLLTQEASTDDGAVLTKIIEAPAGTEASIALNAVSEVAATLMPERITLLGAREAGRAMLLFRAGPSCTGTSDVRPALQAALAILDGRGGGKPERAQGSGSQPAALEEALAAARAAISQ